MTEISKLSAFAAGGTNKIDKNRVDMSERAKLAKNGIDFKPKCSILIYFDTFCVFCLCFLQ